MNDQFPRQVGEEPGRFAHFAVRERAVEFAASAGSLVLGGLGGLLFWLLGLPLPWMAGAMIATSIAAALGVPVRPVSRLREVMIAVVGVMLGASFTGELLAHIWRLGGPLTGLLISNAVGAALAYLVLCRLPGTSKRTAYFAAMPGGIIEMVTLARQHGGDERIVALVHAARIFFAVLTLPYLLELVTGQPVGRGQASTVSLVDIDTSAIMWFLGVFAAGLLLNRLVSLPAGQMVAPMLVSIGVHALGLTDFRLPVELVSVAQLVIGASIGARFAGIGHRLFLHAMALSVPVAAVLIACAVATAWGIHELTDRSMPSMVLSYSPGGLAEMSLIALALGVDVAFVAIHHLTRIVLVIALGSVLLKRMT